jgi:hypothetical protein
MTERLWKLREIEPSARLDARVRRSMRGARKTELDPRGAAPFLPLEGVVYALAVALYVVYAAASAVRLLKESRAQHAVLRLAEASSVTAPTPPPHPSWRSSSPSSFRRSST